MTQPGFDASPIREATETRTNSSPGRARHKPSNHCAGKAGRFRLHLCFLCASLRIRSAQRPWVPAGTRSSLRPLHGEGEKTSKARAEHAARMRGRMYCLESARGLRRRFKRVIARSEATKQSRLSPRRHSGLLRCARNGDGERPDAQQRGVGWAKARSRCAHQISTVATEVVGRLRFACPTTPSAVAAT